MVVAGSEAGSLWHSQELNARAAAKDKELFIVPGETHKDSYDGGLRCGDEQAVAVLQAQPLTHCRLCTTATSD